MSHEKRSKEELPQSFNVRYLGFREASGLWGIKHTRKPVDAMVNAVKESQLNLSVIKLIISKEGCKLESIYNGKIEVRFYPVEIISYGVQDLIYTRVFSMIVVRETRSVDESPFECHAFVCDSRQSARKLTYTLAAAFDDYSQRIRPLTSTNKTEVRKKFAIDLRSELELRNDLQNRDSEA